MSDVPVVIKLTGYQLRSMSRNARAIVFTIAFPIVLYVLSATVFAKKGNSTTSFHGTQIKTDAYFLAGMIAYAIMMSAFSTICISLTTQRESGLLKRFRGTPLAPWAFIAAQVVRSILLTIVEVVALLIIGRVAFGVGLSGSTLGEVAIYVVLGTFALCTLGVALTGVVRTADAAATVAPFSAILLGFISGVFIPVHELPSGLVTLGKVFPLAHLAEGLQAAMLSGHLTLRGENVAVVAIWGCAALIFAQHRFRWEPQGRGTG